MKIIAKPVRWFAAASVIVPLLGACGGGPEEKPALRATTYGLIEGVTDASGSGTYYWKGVPFAKAPVGELRWKAPVDPDAWTSVRQAKNFGNACAQFGRLYGPGANNTYDATIATTLNQPVGSEDCLTLNIWRPANDQANLPVIYFIYGGSNISGYAADPVYDGAALAKAANAIVITANYRLGLFGWLNLPQLKTGANAQEDSGNFATLDQIQTLKFINKNINGFGGNPNNVTVMGESAGALNIYALLTSPLMVSASPRLFHKVVPMSGGLATAAELPPGSMALLQPAAYSLAQGNKLLYSLLIADGLATDDTAAAAYAATQSSTQIAAYMRSKSPTAIFTQLLTRLAGASLNSSSHIPDGTVVANTPVAAINAGNYVKVPVLASNTRDEGKLFAPFLPLFGLPAPYIVSDAVRFSMMANFNPDAPATLTAGDILHASYLPVTTPTTGFNARTDFINMISFAANNTVMLNALKAQQPNVWHSQFNWDKMATPWNEVYGATHAFDLPFVFGNFGPSLFSNVIGGAANRDGRLALSGAMMSTIGTFARNGDPNNAALGVTWPAWPQQLIFDATLTGKNISVQ